MLFFFSFSFFVFTCGFFLIFLVFVFACVSFLFCFFWFFTFGVVKGNARYGRSRYPPTNQSFRVCIVNLATPKRSQQIEIRKTEFYFTKNLLKYEDCARMCALSAMFTSFAIHHSVVKVMLREAKTVWATLCFARRRCAERSELLYPFRCTDAVEGPNCCIQFCDGELRTLCSDHLTNFKTIQKHALLSCMTCLFADVDDARIFFVMRWHG